MEGWIKLHRKITEWEWYGDINVCRIFLHLLLTSNHESKKWRGIIVLRGQKLTSIKHLAKETNLTIQSTRTALNKLKSTNEITIKTTSKYTLITIVKYNDYQLSENENNKQNNEQDNKRATNEQQTNNKQTTTNKNEKNVKNDKNEKKITTISDSCVDGLQEVIDFYNNNIGMITPYGLEILEDYAKELGKDLVIYAMQISVEANKRTIQYIKAILNNWGKTGIKTVTEAKQEKNKSKSTNAEEEFLNEQD